jgi:hypothetical protein
MHSRAAHHGRPSPACPAGDKAEPGRGWSPMSPGGDAVRVAAIVVAAGYRVVRGDLSQFAKCDAIHAWAHSIELR